MSGLTFRKLTLFAAISMVAAIACAKPAIFHPAVVESNGLTATLERWDGGSGELDISNGIIFAEGDVTEAMVDDREIRVFVDGVEQEIYAEALDGRWPDGSVKSVLIQFANTFTGSVTAEVRLNEVRQTTDLSIQTLNPSPDGLLYLTDETYLCNSFPLWWEIIPQSLHPTSPDSFGVELDSIHTKYESTHDAIWANVDAASGTQNKFFQAELLASYSFGQHTYTHFCMTGDSEYLKRCIEHCWNHSDGYGNPNNWGLPEWYSITQQNMLLHYWLTGHDDSRTAAYQYIDGTAYDPDDWTTLYLGGYLDGRLLASHLFSLVVLMHLDQGTIPSMGGTGGTWPTNAAKARGLVDAWIAQQETDGSRKHTNNGNADCTLSSVSGTFQQNEYIRVNGNINQNYLSTISGGTYVIGRNSGGTLVVPGDSIYGQTSGATATVDTVGTFRAGTQPWMNMLANHALIAYSRWISSDRDTEIKECIENDYEWMDQYWISGDRSWPIYDTEANFHVVPTAGSEDLNAFPLAVLEWLIEHETDEPTKAAYIARADDAVKGLDDGGFWSASGRKQFSEMNWGLWQYVARREEE